MFSTLHPAPSLSIDLEHVDNDSSPDLPVQRQLPSEPRARALESKAREVLQQAHGPTKEDLVQLFQMLPPHFVRTTTSGDTCGRRGIASPPHAVRELHAGTAAFSR